MAAPMSELFPSTANAMQQILQGAFSDAATPERGALPNAVADACATLVTGGSETCRLVALTVIAGTAAEPRAKPDVIQEGAGGWDFRSLYKSAIRPVLVATAKNASVAWDPSVDPFVSNPFREARIDQDWVTRRKNKLPGAASLLAIVQHVATEPQQARLVLTELAAHELERLGRLRVNYRIPQRLTTSIVEQIVDTWLKGGVGGRRLESASVALLRCAGTRLRDGWDDVESHHVNDPRPYDALCRTDGVVRAIGEVKDMPIKLVHVEQLAKELASHGAIRGYLFTQRKWWPHHAETERDRIEAFIRDRSVLGLRIDVVDIMEIVRVWLALIDQDDRTLPDFLTMLKDELERHGLPEDRRALADVLDGI